MKILFVGPLSPPITGQTIANEMAVSGLLKLGHNVAVRRSWSKGTIEDASQQGKIRYYKIILSIFAIIHPLFSLIKSRPDVLYLNPGLSFLGFIKYFPLIIISKIFRIPIIVHFHGGHFPFMYRSLRPILRYWIDLSFRCIEEVILLGKTLKIQFEELNIDVKTSICENGIDSNLILTEQELQNKIERQKRGEVLRILFLSNIIRSKGILDLLNAIELMNYDGVILECDIAGSIDKDIEQEFYHKLNHLKEQVRFHGSVKGPKKRELLLGADIFCLPTYYPIEGQPISLLEAFGAGCKAIVTDHSGIRDVFENGKNGFFCKEKNPQSIIDAIKNSQKSVSISGFNVEKCKQFYTEDKFSERLDSIISKYCNSKIDKI